MYIPSSKSAQSFELDPRVLSLMRASRFVEGAGRMIKTASSDSETWSTSLVKALASVNLEAKVDLAQLLQRLIVQSEDGITKTAKKKDSSRQDIILIASKHIKDSHYQVDLSKDSIVRDDKRLFMIGAYVREAYLGRYIIKRNFFFLSDNESGADEAFEEIRSKVMKIKSSYHNGQIGINEITGSISNVLTGIVPDLRFKEENDIGTTVKRD